jgi:hypothetical protein
LTLSHGTLECRRSPVENHCTDLIANEVTGLPFGLFWTWQPCELNNLLCNPSATEVDVEQEVDFGVLLGREHVGHALRVVPELKFLSQINKDCDKQTNKNNQNDFNIYSTNKIQIFIISNDMLTLID